MRCCSRNSSSIRGTSRCNSPATGNGNLVHLFERDCSVQRNNQKVLGGSPGAQPTWKACEAKALRRRH